MNTPSFGKFSPRWLAEKGLIVTLLAGLAILALGRGMNLPAREVYRERQIRQLGRMRSGWRNALSGG
nr:Uncharacterised protein [Klebsiella pneumoniae]